MISNFSWSAVSEFMSRAKKNRIVNIVIVLVVFVTLGVGIFLYNQKSVEAIFYSGTSSFSTGSEPLIIKSADFDGVNGADVAYIYGNLGSYDVQVALKNGTASFAAPVSYAITWGVSDLCIADFDNSGSLDIALATITNMLAILYNNGSGVFTETIITSTGDAGHIDCQDINGDNKPDVEISAGNDLVIFTNNNWTGFNSPASYSFGFAPAGFAIGDLNSDGYPDAIASNTVYSGQSGAAIIRNNAGSGFLTVETGYVIVHPWCSDSPYCYPNTSANNIEIADFDGDGKNDIVATGRNVSYNSFYIYISQNSTSTPGGVVTFNAYLPKYISNSITTYFPMGLTVFDRDGDGDKDITVVTLGGIAYITNNGGFSFTGPDAGGRLYAGGSSNRSITSGDFDLDGDTDVAYAAYGADQIGISYNDTMPVLSSVAPTIIAKGDSVNLVATGGNYAGAGVSTVKFNGSNVSTTFNSETQLTAAITSTETAAIGTYPITVFNGAPGGGLSGFVDVTVVPRVSFTTATSFGAEEVATQADFTISLSDAVVNDVVVNYTLTGTANNTNDYVWSLSGQATILAGNTSVVVSMPLNDDLLDEADETIIMTLDNVVGSDALVSNSLNTHTYTIIDNDPPPSAYVDSITYSGSEGTTVNIYLDLTEASGRAVTVNYSLANISTIGADYTAPSGSVVFNPGETQKLVAIPLLNDMVIEGNETFSITIDSSDWSILGSPLTTTVTINNVTPPEISFYYTAGAGTEGSTVGSVDVQMSYQIPVPFTVYYSISDITSSPSDYTTSGSFIFPANTTVAYGALIIDLTADATYESSETFDLNLTSATLANIGTPASIPVTIYDNHPAPFGTSQNINENNAPSSQTQQLTLTLPTAYAADSVSVDVAVDTGGTAVSGTDFNFTPTTVTFPPNTTTATFNVTTITDTTYDASGRTINFILSNCNCDLTSPNFTVTIIDTQANTQVYNTFQTLYENNSPGSQAQPIYLDLSPNFPATVTFDVNITGGTAVSGVDYTFTNPTTVTILANNYSGTFNVTTISDATYNDPKTIDFTISNCVNCNLVTTTFTATIYDNNNSAWFAAPSATVAEGNSDSSSLYVHLDTVPASAQTVIYHINPASTATYGVDYTINTTGDISYNSGTNTGTITFNTSIQDVAFTIETITDALTEGNESVILVLDSFSDGQVGVNPVATMTIQDPEAYVYPVSVSTSEATTSVNMAVNLNKTFANTTIVNYHLANVGTTTYTSDYTINAFAYGVTYAAAGSPVPSNIGGGTFTFYPGETSRTVYFNIVNDLVGEPDETFQLVLDSFNEETNITAVGGISATAGTYSYTILNNDANRISFSPTSGSGSEATTPVSISVGLDTPDLTQNTTFNLLVSGTATDGTDFTVSTGPYTITQGNSTTNISLSIIDDLIDEANKTVVLTLTNISANVVGGSVVYTYTIQDNDNPYAKIFLDNGYTTEANTSTNKITTGNTIYLKVNDARFNTSLGSVDTISSSYASVTGTLGDSEAITLTETAANSNVFQATLVTAVGTVSTNDGTLQLTASDIVNLNITANAATSIDDFSVYASTNSTQPAMMSSANGQPGYWSFSGGTPSLVTGGNQYLQEVVTGNGYVLRNMPAGLNVTGTNLSFDISISNSSYTSSSWVLGPQTFTGFNLIVKDASSCYYYNHITSPALTSTPQNISIPVSAITQSSLSGTCTLNWSTVTQIFFIVPASGSNTITIDNFSQNTTINYASNDAAIIGGITLNTPINLTTSSMDLSWTQSDDVNFINYKVYYATHSTVTTADTLAATITNVATLTNTLTGLSSSTLYYVRVLVTSSTEPDVWSNEVSATTSAPSGGYCQTTDGMICFSNSGFTADATAPLSIGSSVYLKMKDTAFDTNASCVDVVTVTLKSIDGSSVVRDTESITLTETGSNTGIFTGGDLTTSSVDAVGVLALADGDTITSKAYSVGQNFDDSYSVSHPVGDSGITSNFLPCPTDPNVIEEVVSSSNTSGDVMSISLTSPLNLPDADSLVTMRVKFDTTAQLGTTTAIPFPFQFTGLNIMVTNNTGGNNIAAVTWPSTSIVPDGQWFNISVPRSDFSRTEDLGGGAVPLSSGDWTSVSSYYVIFPNNSSNVTATFDNIGVAYTSAYSDSIAVTDTPPPGYCETTNGMICFSNSGFTTDASASLTIGNSIYVVVHDTSFNLDATCSDTLIATLKSVDGSSITRDIESVTMTETGANTGTFHSTALATSATDSDGVLYVAGSDTIHVKTGTVINNFADGSAASYASFTGGTLTSSVTCGSQKLEMVNGAAAGMVFYRVLGPSYPVGEEGFAFRTSVNPTSSLSSFTNLGGSFTVFSGFNVAIQAASGTHANYSVVPSGIISADATDYTITVKKSDFTLQPDFGSGTLPSISLSGPNEWDDPSNIIFIMPTAGVSTTTTIDDLTLAYTSVYTDTLSVEAGNPSAGITVTATIPPLLAYTLSSYNCNLGSLTDTALSVCNFDISVSTNAAAGYVAYIESQNNGVLTSGSNQIGAASTNTISAGTAGWGVGTSESGLGSAGEIPTTADCTSSISPTLSGLTTSPLTVARSTQPADSRSTNICVGATISSTTPAGSYSDNVVITIVGNF